MRWAGAIAVVGILAAAGCEETGNPAPSLSGVAPSSVVQEALPETVAVTGANLLGVAATTLDDDPPVLDNDWSAALDGDPIEATWIDETRIEAVVPAGTALGVYDVSVTSPDGTVLELPDALTVTEEPIGLAVAVEDAPGGAGAPIGDVELSINDSLDAYAVIYDTEGVFLMDAEVTWSVSGGIGAIPAGPSTSATFVAGAEGQGVITAAHDTADDGATGTITVGGIAGECAGCTMGTCLDECATPSCLYECGAQCECTFDCTDVADTCDVSCSVMSTCDIDCTNASRCDIHCDNTSNCTVTCAGSDCSGARCQAFTSCSFDCTDAVDCGDIECVADAECIVDCTGATACDFAFCDGGPPMSCPDDVIVCNRDCP